MFSGLRIEFSAPLMPQEGLACPQGTWWNHTFMQQSQGTITCYMGRELRLELPLSFTTHGHGHDLMAWGIWWQHQWRMLQPRWPVAPLPPPSSSSFFSSSSQQGARQSQSGGLTLAQRLDGQVRRRRYTSQGWEASCDQSRAFPLGAVSRVVFHPSPETTQCRGLGEGVSLDYIAVFWQRAGLGPAIITAQAMGSAWPPLATSHTGQ